MEKLKLVFDFLKFGFYTAMFYFLCQVLISCMVWIIAVAALALILDFFKKPKIEEKKKKVPDFFMELLRKQKNKSEPNE